MDRLVDRFAQSHLEFLFGLLQNFLELLERLVVLSCSLEVNMSHHFLDIL
jgi:hypothetical protein